MSNDIDLATAIFGNKRLEDGTAESVKIMTGTAVSDSVNGKVDVVIDGTVTGEEYDGELQDNVIELDTSPNVLKGDIVQITCSGGISKSMMVTSVLNSGDRTQETADLAQYCADEAFKVATNFISKENNIITIGDFDNGELSDTIAQVTLNTDGASVTAQGTTKSISLDGHTHSTSDITSGTLPVSRGGTGKTSGTFYGETVLYDSETGTVGEVALSESAKNFKYLEIYFNYSPSNGLGAPCGYTKVYSPNNKYVSLNMAFQVNTENVIQILTETVDIYKGTIHRTSSNGWFVNGNVSSTGVIAGNNSALNFYITRVVGIK